jgi:tRNA pseudouridine55 synthase
MPILKIHKPIGETPLETIGKLNIPGKISYAGRLDPMAEGQLLVLTGEDCQQQNDYHNLDKIYRFELLLGLTTDSYDILGIVNNDPNPNPDPDPNQISIRIADYCGKHCQSYPPFSSARVKGKPLWYYAQNNLMDTVQDMIPSKTIQIYSSIIIRQSHISKAVLVDRIHTNIDKISAKYDFRQEAIKKQWTTIANREYPVIEVEMAVSSGTYIRGICHDMGGIALSINRLACI